ncbi:MAG TPA: cyclic nucleotide-binding domain-containing protein [Acidobacteriaceae bacterium]|nr:cyclic nucleotide-binding domain-containing protein [Acidobacteriaceae bacterium]
MSAELVRALDAVAVPARVAQGATLFRAGEDARAAYTVRGGSLALLSAVPAQFAPMQIVGPESIVGLPGVLTGVYSIAVRASEDSEVGFIARDRIITLLESNPRLCLDALRLVSEQVGRLRAILRATDVAARTRRLLLDDFRSPAYSVSVPGGLTFVAQNGS